MAAAASRMYVLTLGAVSVSAAISLVQVVTGAKAPLQIIRATISQSSSTTSTQQRAQLNKKKTTAATVTSQTPALLGPSTDPAANAVGGAALSGVNASAEGTDDVVSFQDVFNYLNGWIFLPTPKEYLFVDVGGVTAGINGGLVIKLPSAPGSAVTLVSNMIFEELA
jgi:hypothetical protein